MITLDEVKLMVYGGKMTTDEAWDLAMNLEGTRERWERGAEIRSWLINIHDSIY